MRKRESSKINYELIITMESKTLVLEGNAKSKDLDSSKDIIPAKAGIYNALKILDFLNN